MKLATIRLNDEQTSRQKSNSAEHTAAVRVDSQENDSRYTVIDGYASLSKLLCHMGGTKALEIAKAANGQTGDFTTADLAPVLPQPEKIICVGVNYLRHIAEMGREPAKYPTFFAKFPNALAGAKDPLVIPRETNSFDYEGELAVIIGKRVRRVKGAAAREAIFGYTIANDGSARDWQNRTPQWDQGKMWDGSTPLGPVIVTPDEVPDDAQLVTHIDGEVRQCARINDRLFDSVALVEYLSTIMTLKPGDVILTGTPGGVGHGMTPPRYLTHGNLVEISIAGIGKLANRVVAEA